MRTVVYLLLAAGCAALPLEYVRLALLAAEKTDTSSTDGRIPVRERSTALAGVAGGAVDVEGLADVLGDSLPLALVATEKSDLRLLDGRIFKAARIVATSETTVTVAHAEGLTDVENERVPLDLLEASQAEIAATAAAQKEIEAEVAAFAAERIREDEARRVTELQVRMALAVAPPDLPGGAETGIPLRATDPMLRLLALQERFPARKKGKNDLGLEFDLPPRSVWSFYSAYFLAATLEQLPETLAILEARLTQDLAAWDWKSKSTQSIPQSAEHVQAQRTVEWLSQTLRGYLQEARQLARAR